MKTILLSILLVSIQSYAQYNQSCSAAFTGFFERTLVQIPIDPAFDSDTVLGQEILTDINEANLVTPSSHIAKQGFAGLGKCFTLPLNSGAKNVGILVTVDFSIGAIAISDDKATVYYFKPSDRMVTGQCRDYQQQILSAVGDKIKTPNFDGKFLNGSYITKVEGQLFPYKREIRLTRDAKYVISKLLVDVQNGQDLYQVCAFRNQSVK